MHKHQKGIAPIIIILGVLFLVGISGSGYYLIKQQKSNNQEQNTNQNQNKDLAKENNEENKNDQQVANQDSNQQLGEKEYEEINQDEKFKNYFRLKQNIVDDKPDSKVDLNPINLKDGRKIFIEYTGDGTYNLSVIINSDKKIIEKFDTRGCSSPVILPMIAGYKNYELPEKLIITPDEKYLIFKKSCIGNYVNLLDLNTFEVIHTIWGADFYKMTPDGKYLYVYGAVPEYRNVFTILSIKDLKSFTNEDFEFSVDPHFGYFFIEQGDKEGLFKIYALMDPYIKTTSFYLIYDLKYDIFVDKVNITEEEAKNIYFKELRGGVSPIW